MFKKKKREISSKEISTKKFEDREELSSIVLLVTIINRGQSLYFEESYKKLGATLSLTLYGYSLPPEQYRSILGVDTKKEIILTFTKGDNIKSLLECAKNRFAISRAAKGIAFTINVNSISGIAAYKYLINNNLDANISKNK